MTEQNHLNDENAAKGSEKEADALAECVRLRDEYLAGWQRAKADFMNLQREMDARAREEFDAGRRTAIGEMLVALDHFAMAAEKVPDTIKDDAWTRGVLEIRRTLEERLRQMGLETIEAVGKVFDPKYYEAMESLPSEKPEGTVIEEMQRGYMYKGRVLRPARVKVAGKSQSA